MPFQSCNRLGQRGHSPRIGDFREQAAHHTWVAVLVPLDARLYHPLAAHHGEIKPVPGRLGQRFHKDALRAPIPFAKRMHGVETDHHIRGTPGKFLPRQTAQIVLARQFSKDTVEFPCDARTFHERLSVNFAEDRLGSNCAVGQLHALVASAPCPFVDVLKKMPVNRFQMRGVEISLRPVTQLNLQQAIRDAARFRNLKRPMVS
jgi:hypothetical protein